MSAWLAFFLGIIAGIVVGRWLVRWLDSIPLEPEELDRRISETGNPEGEERRKNGP